MNILVVCQFYYPEQFKINEICEQLVKDGHSVTVLTGLPNYPTGKIPIEYKWGRNRKETHHDVNIIRTFEIGRKNGVIGLALNYLSFMVSASMKTIFLEKVFDIIFVYQLSPVTMVLPGIIMKKRTGKPLFLYCCDIWPESMKNLISNEKNPIYIIAKKFSKYLYSKCDAITVTSKPFIEYFMHVLSIPAERISYIPQHAEDIAVHRAGHKDNDITDFVFLGNIGIAQNTNCIIDAVERIKHMSKFRVHFVGDGSCLRASISNVQEKGLNEIISFHGYHPATEMCNYYQLADACLLTLTADNLVGSTMPSKLQGYMSAGKMVIAAINGAAKEVIKESECGLCVDAGDSKALAEAMKEFIKNPEKFKACGENGRRYYINNFTKSIFMTKLENEFNKLVGV